MSEARYTGCLLTIGLMALLGQVMADSAAPLSDPTRPNGWREKGRVEAPVGRSTANTLVLQGTFSVAGRRSAMIGGRRVTLAQPQTFMNLSGVSVKSLLTKFSLTAEDLILVYDELSLPWTGSA